MAPPALGKLARARLVEPEQGNLFGGGAELVRQALKQGQTEKRYGRIWHLGHVLDVGDFLYGRLGYERRVDMDRWHKDKQDFARASVDGGAAAPFAIRLSDLVVVYQPRKQDITPVSFVGALRSMLRIEGEGWRIESLTGEGASFDSWRATVDVVTRLRFRLERGILPRPYLSEVVQMIDDVHSDLSSVEWRADGGLDTNAPLVRQLIDQVEAGIGEVVADGRCGHAANATRRWSSVAGDESVMTEVDADPVTGQVGMQTLLAQFDTISPQ